MTDRPNVNNTHHVPKHPLKAPKRPKFRILITAVAIVLLLALVVIMIFSLVRNMNSASYRDSDIADEAAFELQLNYQRDCEGRDDCNPSEPNYDFLVFVFNDEGRQVRIVRGDESGQYKASLPEGEYTLLTSKTFKNMQGLPQETVELKNGKVLELQVNYGMESVRKQ